MRLLKFISISFTCLFILFACKTKQILQNYSRTDSVYIQRLVPISLPSDTARVKALLECNAQGKVVAHQLNIETTRNARLSFLLDSLGNLLVQSITEIDTIYIKADSIHVKTILTEYIEIPAKLTKWQNFRMKFGNMAFWVLIVSVILGATLLVVKMKK